MSRACAADLIIRPWTAIYKKYVVLHPGFAPRVGKRYVLQREA